ncbi:MAG: hypothetical protein ABSB13_07730 [Candidatus Binatus sp.]
MTALLVVLLCLFVGMNVSAQGGSPSVGNSQNQETKDQQSQTQKPPTPAGAFISISATPANPTPTPNGAKPDDNSQSVKDWFWQNLTGLLLVLVGIWAACIALGTLDQIATQTSAATTAANAAMKSADVSSQDLEIANRAYLYLSEVRIRFSEAETVDDDETIYRYEIFYPIYNGGPTPALYKGVFARAEVLPTAPKDINQNALTFDKPQDAVIPPHVPQPISGQYSSFVSKEELDDLRAGKRKLFFYGVLTYDDIFGKERHTRFTLGFSGTPERPPNLMLMAFVSGKGFNWFD